MRFGEIRQIWTGVRMHRRRKYQFDWAYAIVCFSLRLLQKSCLRFLMHSWEETTTEIDESYIRTKNVLASHILDTYYSYLIARPPGHWYSDTTRSDLTTIFALYSISARSRNGAVRRTSYFDEPDISSAFSCHSSILMYWYILWDWKRRRRCAEGKALAEISSLQFQGMLFRYRTVLTYPFLLFDMDYVQN